MTDGDRPTGHAPGPAEGPPGAPPHVPPDQEEDRLRADLVLSVGIASLVVFALGILWAARIQRSVSGQLHNVATPAAELGKPEIGIVDQVLFDGDPRPAERLARDRRLLEQWSWEDRAHGVVRMPIERAMEQVVRGAQR